MADSIEFVEFEGCVHLITPAGGGEYSLCGMAADNEGTEHQPTTKRVVTCPDCARVIEYCRGVRFRVEAR